MTKYDCSSADINPIGSIDKSDLKRLISWAEREFDLPCLRSFLNAVPTAELEPITEAYVQSDEADMGMTYDELSALGRARKVLKLGPFGTFQRMVYEWRSNRPQAAGDDAPRLGPRQVAEKVGLHMLFRSNKIMLTVFQVKRFYHYYRINRHKMTTLTPALHCNDYSPDDNRFDQRPFLLPQAFGSWEYKKIDANLEKIGERTRRMNG